MALASSARPIEGAVATLGVSDRVTFLRKTYAHLGIALVAFAAMTGGLMRFAPEVSWGFSKWALQGTWTWLAVIGLFMVVGYVAERLARSESSKGVQYVGLGIGVAAYAILLQPMLWILMLKFGNAETMFVFTESGNEVIPALSPVAASILTQAVVITLAIFSGLTAVVFVTKKDFSFMRGVLAILTFGALGVIVASLMFGFSLGALFSGAMILLMAGYILYQTSLVMAHFPPAGYVGASLMLFSTIATLFWYVLQLMMSLRRD
ncbi:MAG: Bax inhibitor-1 family protein [Deltaproteobacteria bacterium]|nr:Bax inhibitor-1 family protein [Deltaproteobacteria bacterium]